MKHLLLALTLVFAVSCGDDDDNSTNYPKVDQDQYGVMLIGGEGRLHLMKVSLQEADPSNTKITFTKDGVAQEAIETSISTTIGPIDNVVFHNKWDTLEQTYTTYYTFDPTPHQHVQFDVQITYLDTVGGNYVEDSGLQINIAPRGDTVPAPSDKFDFPTTGNAFLPFVSGQTYSVRDVVGANPSLLISLRETAGSARPLGQYGGMFAINISYTEFEPMY